MDIDKFLALIAQRRKEGVKKVELFVGFVEEERYDETFGVLDISENIWFEKDTGPDRDGMIIYWNTKAKIPRGQIPTNRIVRIKDYEK